MQILNFSLFNLFYVYLLKIDADEDHVYTLYV